eukprot:11435065-Alexandrium_andersonii.AAC.1
MSVIWLIPAAYDGDVCKQQKTDDHHELLLLRISCLSLHFGRWHELIFLIGFADAVSAAERVGRSSTRFIKKVPGTSNFLVN